MVLRELFNPSSIAIIGASKKPGKLGHEVFKMLLRRKQEGVFKGELYPVNPTVGEIAGVRCYPDVFNIPGDVSLAIILVPASIVPQVVEDCGRRGVKRVIIVSSGFSEIGGEGRRLEGRVLEIARKYGVRVVGPNCMGVVDPYTGVDTFFLPEYKDTSRGPILATPRPFKGHISLVTQSGALGVACLDYMYSHGLGLCKFVGYGNGVDLDECDFIEFLSEDEATRVILLYVEGIKKGRLFLHVAKEASKRKPIIVFKAGRTEAGSRAVSSHTGSLSGIDEVYEAAFKQSGLIRAYNIEEFFDLAKALAYMPPACSRKVAILTDGGGAGIMAVDKCESLGLEVSELSEETRRRLKDMVEDGRIPPYANIGNPIDLTGSATDDMYVECLKLLFNDDNVGSIIVLALHHVPTITEELPFKLIEIIKTYKKPTVVCDIGRSDFAIMTREAFEKNHIPTYEIPERAALGVYGLVSYGEYLRKNNLLKERLKEWKPL